MLIIPWPFQLMLEHVPCFEVISTYPQQWQGQSNSMCLISMVVKGPKYGIPVFWVAAGLM
jgi:hypothetical protein